MSSVCVSSVCVCVSSVCVCPVCVCVQCVCVHVRDRDFSCVLSLEIVDHIERLQVLKEIVNKFPPVNYLVFKYIIAHLNRYDSTPPCCPRPLSRASPAPGPCLLNISEEG